MYKPATAIAYCVRALHEGEQSCCGSWYWLMTPKRHTEVINKSDIIQQQLLCRCKLPGQPNLVFNCGARG